MKDPDIHKKVFDGIRKTINRFREKPFHYFTESDIHSSLLNDMMRGGSDVLAHRPQKELQKHISVSLVHQEYPTNFRYVKDDLVHPIDPAIAELSDIKPAYGDRGNYDLAVLNPEFVIGLLKEFRLEDALRHAINKDNQWAIRRKKASLLNFQQELLYAIEVKFIHPFNARQKEMIWEVIKDDHKLLLAYKNSGGFLRPINLVFCSTAEKKRDDNQDSVVSKIKDYIRLKSDLKDYDGMPLPAKPVEVVTIFIESFLEGEKSFKTTAKPIVSRGTESWAEELKGILKI